MKGQLSDRVLSDPQLHYILRLYHSDTTLAAAGQWMQKLDHHNARHAEDEKKLSDAEMVASGDLVIIVSFIHFTSTATSSAPVSLKSGLLIAARAAELESELNNIKPNADCGDHLIPIDNLLEQQMATYAPTALDDSIFDRIGAKPGSLYENIVQDSLRDLEKMRFVTGEGHVKQSLGTWSPFSRAGLFPRDHIQ